MTRFIAAYDTERPTGRPGNRPACVEACEAIVAMHQRHEMPATFFIVGQTLEDTPDAYRRLLDDPLFEIASHTWSHRLLKDNPFCGQAVTGKDLRDEVLRGKESVEKHFPDRTCIGLRPGYSFVGGLRDAPEVLALVKEAGYQYVSSTAWGPDFTMTAPLTQAHDYAEDGYPELREYPAHGWHDNVLKHLSASDRRVLPYPLRYPEMVPREPIETPEQEFTYNSKCLIDRARRMGLDYVNPIWHPWSLGAFDPDMDMLELTFSYVREQGLEATTFARMHTDAVTA